MVALLSALTLSACQRAHTDFDPRTEFSTYKTFAWTGHDTEGESMSARDFPDMLSEVRTGVITGLKARGLTVATPGKADLLVTAHVEIVPYKSSADTHIKGRDIPARKLGPIVLAPYSVTQIDNEAVNREMREGTLLVNLSDRRSRALVWQGWISQVFDLNKIRAAEWDRTPDKGYLRHRQRTIQKAVDRILSDFPPKSATAQPAR